MTRQIAVFLKTERVEQTRNVYFPDHSTIKPKPHQKLDALNLIYAIATSDTIRGVYLAATMGAGKSFINIITLVLIRNMWQSHDQRNEDGDTADDACPHHYSCGMQCWYIPESLSRKFAKRARRRPALITCPPAVISHWGTELGKYLGEDNNLLHPDICDTQGVLKYVVPRPQGQAGQVSDKVPDEIKDRLVWKAGCTGSAWATNKTTIS